MFTENDIKSIFALFPPQTSADFTTQLSLASSGNGFVTLQFVQANFRSRVMKGRFFVLPRGTLANSLFRNRTNPNS